MLITKRTIYIAVLSLICFSTEVYGQSFEEYRQRTMQQFENRRQTVRNDYEAMRAKVNKEFSDMLGREWKPSGESSFRRNPLREIPSLPSKEAPVVAPKPMERECEAVVVETMSSKPEPVAEISGNPGGSMDEHRFIFYGNHISIRFDVKVRDYLESTSPSDIRKLWDRFSTVDYTNLLADYYDARRSLELCDWASLKLSQKVSAMVYGNDDSNESVVLQSYLLTQCGFRTCLMLDRNNSLHLLVAADKELIDYPSFNIDGNDMYQVDRKDIHTGSVPQGFFNGTVPLRMSVTHPGKMENNPYKTEKGATVNRNDIDFYADYPSFFDEGNPSTAFYYLAQFSLSDDARNTLYPYLKGKIQGMSEVEAVQTILIYFYAIFPYSEDEKVWGKERYFFPEETLYYELSDCEDRAILFTRIVRDILGLKTAVIYMPGHLSAAVKFNSEVDGDAVIANGNRFIICDPTYINASVGQAMPGWEKEDMEVIVL